jgi:hypothetical protein
VGTASVAEYCRAVETHLTRVNGGHLVRIVGPAFVLVREWEAAGIPLSVVERAIDQKAERHRQGAAARSGRPLRIEFCEDDVRELFEDWKRAIGAGALSAPADPAEHSNAPAPDGAAAQRAPSLSKHLERVSDRLSRLLGRHDLPDAFLERITLTISAVSAARVRARPARGSARDEIRAALRPLDAELMTAARLVLDAAEQAALTRQAEGELAAFRTRLGPDAWHAALDTTMNRLLRDRFGLPVIDPDEA